MRPPLTNAKPPRSILIVLPTWVGDFVMATPALRAIRQRFPKAEIAFLAEPNLVDVIRGGDWMDDVLEWPAKARRRPWHREYRALVAHLREREFDWCVLLPNSFRSALLAWQSSANRRIGYNRDGRGWLLTDRIPVKNYVGRFRYSPFAIRHLNPPLPHGRGSDMDGRGSEWLRGRYRPMPIVVYYADLAEHLGCKRPGDQLELFTTEDGDESIHERLSTLGITNRHPLVVISPGAKFGASKCWLPERFAATADRLIDECHASVIVTCGPGEEPIAQAIKAAMRREAVVCDEQKFSLGEMKSLVKRCDLLICNDAGIRHFAKAFGVPVVTIFGPTHPEWTVTSYPRETIVRIDVDCGPCQQKICPLGHHKCMTGVEVEMVVAAAKRWISAPAAIGVTVLT